MVEAPSSAPAAALAARELAQHAGGLTATLSHGEAGGDGFRWQADRDRVEIRGRSGG